MQKRHTTAPSSSITCRGGHWEEQASAPYGKQAPVWGNHIPDERLPQGCVRALPAPPSFEGRPATREPTSKTGAHQHAGLDPPPISAPTPSPSKVQNQAAQSCIATPKSLSVGGLGPGNHPCLFCYGAAATISSPPPAPLAAIGLAPWFRRLDWQTVVEPISWCPRKTKERQKEKSNIGKTPSSACCRKVNRKNIQSSSPVHVAVKQETFKTIFKSIF